MDNYIKMIKLLSNSNSLLKDLVALGGEGGGTPSTAYNTINLISVTDDTLTIAASTCNSITITCTDGESVITVGSSTPVTILEGQTVGWTATELIGVSITIVCGTSSDEVTINTLS